MQSPHAAAGFVEQQTVRNAICIVRRHPHAFTFPGGHVQLGLAMRANDCIEHQRGLVETRHRRIDVVAGHAAHCTRVEERPSKAQGNLQLLVAILHELGRSTRNLPRPASKNVLLDR